MGHTLISSRMGDKTVTGVLTSRYECQGRLVAVLEELADFVDDLAAHMIVEDVVVKPMEPGEDNTLWIGTIYYWVNT